MYDLLIGKHIEDVSVFQQFDHWCVGETVGFKNNNVVYRYTLGVRFKGEVVMVKVYTDLNKNIIEVLGKAR